MNKFKNNSSRLQSKKRLMLRFIILKIYPWAGMANRFPTGSISYTGWVSSTSARSVATIATGGGEPSRCNFRSGGTHME